MCVNQLHFHAPVFDQAVCTHLQTARQKRHVTIVINQHHNQQRQSQNQQHSANPQLC